MTDTKAVSTTTERIVAKLPELAEVQAIIQATLQGGSVTEFQLDRVRVPGAGGTTWTIPTLEGDEETKTIEGVIVGYKQTRGYWSKPYSAANPAPPDCSSNDAVYGSGDRSQYGSGEQECARCPLAEWGSRGEGRRSQACKTMMPVFLLTDQSLLPVVINVPPSSLKTVLPYPLRLAGQGIGWWACVTRFTLEKKEIGGFPTAVIKPELVKRLDKEQADTIRQYVDAIAPLVRRAVVDVESVVAEEY